MQKIMIMVFTFILSVAAFGGSYCKKVTSLNTNVISTPVYKCKDGTISFNQVEDTKYEGRCGQTAAANTIYEYCNKTFL